MADELPLTQVGPYHIFILSIHMIVYFQLNVAKSICHATTVTARTSKAFSNQNSIQGCGCVQLYLEALQLFINCLNVSIYCMGFNATIAVLTGGNSYFFPIMQFVVQALWGFLPGRLKK